MATTTTDRSQWQAARDLLLIEEKKLSKAKDATTAQRRQLPWLRLDREHRLIGEEGEVSLLQLFGHHRMLILRHMMGFDGEFPCPGCSQSLEATSAIAPALSEQAGAAFAAVLKGDPQRVQEVRRLRQWTVPVYAVDSEFCTAMGSDGGAKSWPTGRPGLSVFHRGLPDGSDSEGVYLTYNTFDRGTEELDEYLAWLDRLPVLGEKGRMPAMLDWGKPRYGRAVNSEGQPGKLATACCGEDDSKEEKRQA
jgi:predicted dithiol-disulfide oxidoreductase (DUF899 family)